MNHRDEQRKSDDSQLHRYSTLSLIKPKSLQEQIICLKGYSVKMFEALLKWWMDYKDNPQSMHDTSVYTFSIVIYESNNY